MTPIEQRFIDLVRKLSPAKQAVAEAALSEMVVQYAALPKWRGATAREQIKNLVDDTIEAALAKRFPAPRPRKRRAA